MCVMLMAFSRRRGHAGGMEKTGFTNGKCMKMVNQMVFLKGHGTNSHVLIPLMVILYDVIGIWSI